MLLMQLPHIFLSQYILSSLLIDLTKLAFVSML